VVGKPDHSDIEMLLLLDGEVFPMSSGYWTKFEVQRVEPSGQIPHGIRYSLTVHDRNNRRVIGYDNAHAIKPKKKKYGANRIVWDHRHSRNRIEPYEFESAGQLLEDFWKDVNRILE
jgi:hypothetical protein